MLDILLFADEAWFDLSGYINSQISGMCSAEKPTIRCIPQEIAFDSM